ncbi:hypothetical protein TNCV_2952171 [Trichonephila clavipes]|nr:hypothetical protein TNCV_2952171 [Trichonephila clavipes]
MFVVEERCGELEGQGSVRTFSVTRKVRATLTISGRALSFLICTRLIVDTTIEDVPVCDASSNVAASMVFELRVHAAVNIVELFVQTFVLCQTSTVHD